MDEERREQFQQAYQAWQEQSQHPLRGFLEGETAGAAKAEGAAES